MRTKLVDATISALLDLGGAGATITEICRRAEATSGAIQHHFGSKSGLMTAVGLQLFGLLEDQQAPMGSKQLSFDKRVERLVDHYWKIYGDPKYFAVMEVLLASRHDPELLDLVSHHRELQADSSRRYLPLEFDDVDMSPAEMYRTVQLMLDFLRGCAVRQLFEKSIGLDRDIRVQAAAILGSRFRASLRVERHD